MKCSICGGENVNDAVFCANCGAAITAMPESVPQTTAQPTEQTPPVYQPQSYMPPVQPTPPGYQPPFSPMPLAPDPNDKKALIGMILGIASLPCCCISLFSPGTYAYLTLAICALVGIAGIILSAAGLKSQNKRGMAIAGLVCAIIGTLTIIACIVLVAIGMYAIDSGLYDEIMNQYSMIMFR